MKKRKLTSDVQVDGPVLTLHNETARIFEFCLRMNEFVLSEKDTDYMICMEYEYQKPEIRYTKPYPNITHAWLMYKKQLIIQKVPGREISISKHEAVFEEGAGIIRKHVKDFSKIQYHIMEQIANNKKRIEVKNYDEQEKVTKCKYVPIDKTKMNKDVYAEICSRK